MVTRRKALELDEVQALFVFAIQLDRRGAVVVVAVRLDDQRTIIRTRFDRDGDWDRGRSRPEMTANPDFDNLFRRQSRGEECGEGENDDCEAGKSFHDVLLRLQLATPMPPYC